MPARMKARIITSSRTAPSLLRRTTAIWGGRCASSTRSTSSARYVPIRAGDAGRDWSAGMRRRGRCSLPAGRPGPEDLRSAGVKLPRFTNSRLRLDLRPALQPLRLGNCADPGRSQIQIVTHSTVTRSSRGRGIGGLKHGARRRPACGAGQSVRLAAGGIENPRLSARSGLGNDQVCRYFMEHPHPAAGASSRRGVRAEAFGGGTGSAGRTRRPDRSLRGCFSGARVSSTPR